MRRTTIVLALLSSVTLLGLSPAQAGEILPMDPPPACGDGMDNDGNGLIDYPEDPGCFSDMDFKEVAYPSDYQLETETFTFDPEVVDSTALTEQTYYSTLLAIPDVPSKLQRFTAKFKQAWFVTVITYKGEFRVCYRPNHSVVSWGGLHGDATSTRVPWEWRGNDPGYPWATRRNDANAGKTNYILEVNYRGSAAVCILFKGCGPEKHLWVQVLFYADNGPYTLRWGVA
jgi:hypothetical protein